MGTVEQVRRWRRPKLRSGRFLHAAWGGACGCALGIAIIGGMVLLLFALPVILPFLAWDQKRTRRRQLLALARHPCVVCGSSLDYRALDLADATWTSRVAAMQAGRPHVMLRLVRRLHAVCPACGAEYEWDEASRSFLVPDHLYRRT